MPQEQSSEGGLESSYPVMKLAQLKFEVKLLFFLRNREKRHGPNFVFILFQVQNKVSGREKDAAKELMEAVKADDMAPFYLECCKDLASFKVKKSIPNCEREPFSHFSIFIN